MLYSNAIKNINRKYLGLVVYGVTVGISGIPDASAVTATGNLGVQITINEECVVGSIVNITFPSTGVLLANVDAQGSFTVQCTNGTDYTVGLDAGGGSGATVAVRRMTLSGEHVNYSLYTTAGRTVVWGNTPPTDTVAGLGTGAAIPYVVYGRVPPQATPTPGTYTDTVLISVVY